MDLFLELNSVSTRDTIKWANVHCRYGSISIVAKSRGKQSTPLDKDHPWVQGEWSQMADLLLFETTFPRNSHGL